MIRMDQLAYEILDKVEYILLRKNMKALTYAVFTVDDLTKLSDGTKEQNSDTGNRAFITLEPTSIDLRIENQDSYFLCCRQAQLT